MNNQIFMSFIKRKVQDRAVLLYCEEDIVMDLKNSNANFMQVDKNTDPLALKQLDVRDQESNHKLLVITGECIMRGTDFRAQSKGICLILAKGFSTQRDADQGLMRVGRY